MPDQENLVLLVDEYRSFVHESVIDKGVPDWDALAARLSADGEWTLDGAQHLIGLVQAYGSFVLRNAASLAIAAGIEDGAVGL
ncbi:MAG: hypothetical protein JJU36_07610 [Phycisphaeraceae bacterium]|nr:hypothetical protein [Phycisphaeraceae bacterium]